MTKKVSHVYNFLHEKLHQIYNEQWTSYGKKLKGRVAIDSALRYHRNSYQEAQKAKKFNAKNHKVENYKPIKKIMDQTRKDKQIWLNGLVEVDKNGNLKLIITTFPNSSIT